MDLGAVQRKVQDGLSSFKNAVAQNATRAFQSTPQYGAFDAFQQHPQTMTGQVLHTAGNQLVNTAVQGVPAFARLNPAANLYLNTQTLLGQTTPQQRVQQGLGDALNTGKLAATAIGLPKLGVQSVLANTALGGAFNQFSGGSFAEGAGKGLANAPILAGIGSIANPIVNSMAGKLSAKLPANKLLNRDILGTSVGNRLATGLLNIPEGAVMTGATGQPYSPQNAALDFAAGTLGAKTNLGNKANIRGVNPKAFDLHPDDINELSSIGESIRSKKPLSFEQNKTLERTFKTFFPGANLDKLSNKKVGDLLAYVLDVNNRTPQSERQPFPGLGVVADSASTKAHNLAVSRPLPVTPPKGISALRQGWDRARNVIESQGSAGKELGQNLQTARTVAETSAGNWVSRMPTVRNLSKEEFHNFVDAAEGKSPPLNDTVKQAVQEWSGVRSEIYNNAKQSGLDIGKLENYFPHSYDPSIFKDKNKYNEALNHLVESGQAKTQAEAIQLLSYAQDVTRNRKHGNLEFERLVNLPNYERTKSALFGYVESAANRMAQAQTFGAKDEKALALIEQIARDGGDAQTVKSLYDKSVGAQKYGALQSKISTGLRGYNSISKLGLGAITNTGQNVNTATVVGAIRTLANAPKAALSKEAKDFALKAGVTLDGVINDLKDGSGFSGKVLGNLGAPGFNTVEKFNRTLAAIAGRDYARSLAAKGDTKTLAKMGIQLVGKKLTPEQEVTAARNIVERTQFKVDPQDLPGWASSPWGKVLTQFKSFSYNQSAFIGREILAPLKNGDARPLARFLMVGLPVGFGISEAKNILRNRKDEEDPTKRAIQSYQQVGGLGLASDIYTGLVPQNGKYLDPNRATTLAISTLGGPALGTAAEGYGALANAVQGKPDNLARFALRQVPLVGSTLQNTILPYKDAKGEVNRRTDFGVGSAQAAESSPTSGLAQNTQQTPSATKELSPVEIAQKKQQISDLIKQEKAILKENGVNIFGNQLGGLTTDQKNQKLSEIQAQKQELKNSLTATDERKTLSTITAGLDLQKDRAKRANNLPDYIRSLDLQMQAINAYKANLSPKKDQEELSRLQNKLEDLQFERQKLSTQGGFKKASRLRVKKIRIPKIKSAKVKRTKLKAIKFANPRKHKVKIRKV